MQQYTDLGKRIINDGKWVENSRTGTRCLTVINADLEYDVGGGKFPLLTTRKVPYKSAIMELIGYLRGYSSAKQFRDIGCNTWNSNANDNEAWLNNPNRKGEDDMGFVYGAVARNFPKVGEEGTIDLLESIVNDLSNGIDNRGEILTFYHPGAFDKGCLRPCMFQHQFSILDGTLYLNSYQRSCDVPLGGAFNMIQVYTLLALMAQITGLKPGKAYHKIANAHVYENQLELFKEQMSREPYSLPTLEINPNIKTLEDIETWVSKDDFTVYGYRSHDPINYPFSV